MNMVPDFASLDSFYPGTNPAEVRGNLTSELSAVLKSVALKKKIHIVSCGDLPTNPK